MIQSGGAEDLTVSVVMATRDGERFLAEQLESIARQSRPIGELVVYDDASRDGTVHLLRDFSASAAFPVRVIEGRESVGPVLAFSRAFAESAGNLVFWADQDDRWSEEKVARSVFAFSADPAVTLVCSASRLIDEEGKDLGETYWQRDRMRAAALRRARDGDAFRVVLGHPGFPAHGMAFRCGAVPDLLPVPEEWPIDGWTAALAAARGRMALIDAPLTYHRVHARQAAGIVRQPLTEKLRAAGPGDVGTLERDLRRAQAVGARLHEGSGHQPVASEVETALAERLRLLEERIRMRRSTRAHGLRLLVREVLAGRYRSVGRGWLAVARDLAVVMRAKAPGAGAR